MRIGYTLFFTILFSSLKAQFINPVVDKAPILSSCNGVSDLNERIICSESQLMSLMTLVIDTTACPDSDTSFIYRASLEVDSEGNAQNGVVKSYDGPESCRFFFENRLNGLMDELSFTPAKKEGSAVPFVKKFRIIFPANDSISAYQKDSSGLMKVVEEMPRFVGCENLIGSSNDKNACAQHKMLIFLYGSLKYPHLARENGVEGMVVVQFVVNEMGYIEQTEVVRDIGANCGQAVMDVIESMNMLDPPFIPGKQNGEAVKVLYTMPVNFALESGRKKKKKKRK